MLPVQPASMKGTTEVKQLQMGGGGEKLTNVLYTLDLFTKQYCKLMYAGLLKAMGRFRWKDIRV
jgi:hypothetical protein